MKYTVNLDSEGYVLSLAHTDHDNVELDNIDDITNYLTCCKIDGTKLIIDANKKYEKDKADQQVKIEERKAELHKLLNDSDYLVARTFEQVMSCTNPLTFITDIIAIITKFSAQYGEVIANRQTWRDELEAMEATSNE